MGYVRAKSTPSLVAGVVCGVIALILGYRYAWHLSVPAALALSLFLLVLMGRRYLNTRKVMPALLVVVFSLIVALAQILTWVTLGLGNESLF